MQLKGSAKLGVLTPSLTLCQYYICICLDLGHDNNMLSGVDSTILLSIPHHLRTLRKLKNIIYIWYDID